MQHSFYSEAESSSAGQENVRISWNSRIQYHVRKNPLLVSVLSSLDVLTTYFR
jgi:hypothetical protein